MTDVKLDKLIAHYNEMHKSACDGEELRTGRRPTASLWSQTATALERLLPVDAGYVRGLEAAAHEIKILSDNHEQQPKQEPQSFIHHGRGYRCALDNAAARIRAMIKEQNK